MLDRLGLALFIGQFCAGLAGLASFGGLVFWSFTR